LEVLYVEACVHEFIALWRNHHKFLRIPKPFLHMNDDKKKKIILDTCLFCISIFLLYADQNLLAPNLSKVAEVHTHTKRFLVKLLTVLV